MSERRVSVRLVGVGGKQLKAELVEVGQAGDRALGGLKPAAEMASAGIDGVSRSSSAALTQMEALADRASRAAAAMRAAGIHDGSMVDRINAATGVSNQHQRSRDDVDAYGRGLDELRAKHSPLFAEIQRYKGALADIRQAHAVGAISADEMAAAISRERQASLASIAVLKGRTGAIDQVARSSRGASLRLTQLGYQFNDVGVSIAGGMNPFMVLVQQGTQIAQIYGSGNGGVQQALKDTGSMVTGIAGRFPLVTAAVLAGTVAIWGMRDAINDAGGQQVTFGDTALAVFQVIRDGLWDILKPAVDSIAPWFAMAWDVVIDTFVTVGNALINSTVVVADGIATGLGVIPGLFEAAFALAGSKALTKLHDLLWYAGEALNKFATMVNDTFGTSLNTANFAGQLQWLSDKSGALSVAASEAGATGASQLQDYLGRARAQLDADPLGDFFGAVSEQARENARRREEEEADKKGGKGRKGGGKKSRAAKEKDEVKELETGWGAVLAKLDEYWKDAQDIGPAMGDVLVSSFKRAEDAFGEFLKTGKFGFRDLIDGFLIDFAKLEFRRNILGPLAKGLSGALGGSGALDILWPMNSTGTGTLGLPSFDGGGYTGAGPRSGGLDGRGGFLAMLHPDEDVIDRTRGGRRGGGAPVINVTLNGAAGNQEVRSMVTAGISEALRSYDREQLPRSVGRVSARPRVNAG